MPHPFAVVEDILTRLTLLDAELDEHLGPPPQEAMAGEDACPAARRTSQSAELQEVSNSIPAGSSTIPINFGLLYCHNWAQQYSHKPKSLSCRHPHLSKILSSSEDLGCSK